jgi:hypothetical protein
MYAPPRGDACGPFDVSALSSSVAMLRRRLLARKRELISSSVFVRVRERSKYDTRNRVV